jgi:hypothetical protein
MLGAQAYAIARLAAGPDDRARAMLRLLGTSMIGGYLSEAFNRKVLTGRVVDPVETAIVVVGFAGTIAMAVAAARPQAGR